VALKKQPVRHKYDLAVYIAHKSLHGGDGAKSAMLTGRQQFNVLRDVSTNISQANAVDTRSPLANMSMCLRQS